MVGATLAVALNPCPRRGRQSPPWSAISALAANLGSGRQSPIFAGTTSSQFSLHFAVGPDTREGCHYISTSQI